MGLGFRNFFFKLSNYLLRLIHLILSCSSLSCKYIVSYTYIELDLIISHELRCRVGL